MDMVGVIQELEAKLRHEELVLERVSTERKQASDVAREKTNAMHIQKNIVFGLEDGINALKALADIPVDEETNRSKETLR